MALARRRGGRGGERGGSAAAAAARRGRASASAAAAAATVAATAAVAAAAAAGSSARVSPLGLALRRPDAGGGGVVGVAADTLIWATGYTTGADQIRYVLDGIPLSEPPHAGMLYNHLICPRFPALAISGSYFYAMAKHREARA